MLEIAPGRLEGRLQAPPSKSATHRALLLAALADGPADILHPLMSADTRATAVAITALGGQVATVPGGVRVCPGFERGGDIRIDCANSGTTLRLLTGIAAAREGRTRLDGDASLRTRPMAPLLAALATAGVTVESHDGHAPIAIRGPLKVRDLILESPSSSQFVSSLLLALVAGGRGGTLTVLGGTVSAPYVEMTLEALAHHGVAIAREPLCDGAATRFHVPAGVTPAARPVAIPGDWSSAAFALCGGALSGRVRVDGLPQPAAQADGALVGWLAAMAAACQGPVAETATGELASWLAVEQAPLHAIDANLADCPDLFPILAVTLARASGRSLLYGAPHLRGKETDRIALVARNLLAQGVKVWERPDGIEIEGPARLSGGPIETGGDHRILMAFAVAASAASAPLHFADPDPDAVAAVSYPGFFADLARLGARIQR